MARLLLGVSGGIAAYKALEAARLAVKAGHSVRVIQTPSSLRFVGRASFAAITGGPVMVGEFETDPARGAFPGEAVPDRAPISHLALVERADAYLIAPASANTLAKLAQGHADNLVTAAALAAACPVVVAPAMNNRMWAHPATQANVKLLKARGVEVIEPGVGELASHGEYGAGRLAEPPELVRVWLAKAAGALGAPGATGTSAATSAGTLPTNSDESARDWTGVRVLVTAGGTREPIDSVRFLGNRSSGRMGVALAESARTRGAEVTLIAANMSVPAPAGVDTVPVQTAAELMAACSERFESCDVLLMAAAVADFRPAQSAPGKLKKDAGAPEVRLVATQDVLATLAASRHPRQLLIGFAAEHGAGAREFARGKLVAKDLDAIVLNDVSQAGIGFDSDDNEVLLVTRDGEVSVPRADKRIVADRILDWVEQLRVERDDGDLATKPQR